MFFIFLWEVVKRAFTPVPRVTDGLQVAAASTIPAIAKFAGIKLPATGDDVLAYIGLVAVSFILIRFFWAPYAMWREQMDEVSTLRLELSKPERLVLENLSRLRAKQRLKVIFHADEIYSSGLLDQGVSTAIARHYGKAKVAAIKAGYGLAFTGKLLILAKLAQIRSAGDRADDWYDDLNCLRDIHAYLNDEIKFEYLDSRWPLGTGLETPP